MTAPNAGKLLPEDDPESVGLYVPLHYYDYDDTANPGNKPSEQSGHATLAYALLRSLNESTRVVRGDKALPSGQDLKALVITSSNLVACEIDSLHAYVTSGGKLIWHGLSASYFTGDAKAVAESLVGSSCMGSLNMSAPLEIIFGTNWHLPVTSYLHMSSAPRLGDLRQGTQAWFSSGTNRTLMMTLSKHPQGGAVLASVAAVDMITLSLMGKPKPRDVWAGWFRRALVCVRRGCAADSEAPSAGTEPREVTARAPHAEAAEARPYIDALPKDVLVYADGATDPLIRVALKQLGILGVRARALAGTPHLSPSSFGNASILWVEQNMNLQPYLIWMR